MEKDDLVILEKLRNEVEFYKYYWKKNTPNVGINTKKEIVKNTTTKNLP